MPANMGWLNGTGTRSDFVTMGFPASFAALMGMQEDLQIAEMTRFYLRDTANGETGGDPTRDQEKEAKLLYTDHVELIEGKSVRHNERVYAYNHGADRGIGENDGASQPLLIQFTDTGSRQRLLPVSALQEKRSTSVSKHCRMASICKD